MIPRFVAVTLLVAGYCLAQPAERKEVTVSADILAKYIGSYAMAPPGGNMTITLADGQLYAQLSGQGKNPIFAESDTMFFYKLVNAEIEFAGTSQLILHQNGRNVAGTRLSDAEAKTVADAAEAFNKRFKDQSAAPGSEAAVRRMIGELQAGKPNYDLMSAATRQQVPQIRSAIAPLGALHLVTFKGVGPGGADIYQVTFEKGSLDYRIWLAPDGKIDNVNARLNQ